MHGIRHNAICCWKSKWQILLRNADSHFITKCDIKLLQKDSGFIITGDNFITNCACARLIKSVDNFFETEIINKYERLTVRDSVTSK